MEEILFTIAIPAYKKEYLHECLESVLAQTYPNYEVVVVNDHSPEDLDEIVNGFHDNRIRYYKNEVGFGAEHVVDNWNKCLEYAKGDFIICMGDDDRLKSNFLADLVELIERYPDFDVYYSRTEIIDEQSNVIKVLEERPEHESVYEMIQRRKEGRSMFIGDYCYRTVALRAEGGFYDLPFAWGSDAISAYRAAGQKGVANTNRVGFQYRVNSQTISSSVSNIEGKLDAINRERTWFREFYAQYPRNSEDLELYTLLRKDNEKYFERIASGDVICDISRSPLKNSIKWFRKRSKYGLSRFFVMRCIVHGYMRNCFL